MGLYYMRANCNLYLLPILDLLSTTMMSVLVISPSKMINPLHHLQNSNIRIISLATSSSVVVLVTDGAIVDKFEDRLKPSKVSDTWSE